MFGFEAARGRGSQRVQRASAVWSSENTGASNNIKVTTPGKHATSRKNVPVGEMTRVNL